MSKKLIQEAKDLAKKFHAGQKRWDGEDYFKNHLLVVGEMCSCCWGPNEQVVGILHDILEDTACTREDLFKIGVNGAGDNLIHAVDAITKNDDEEYDEYLARCGANKIARRVKKIDLRHNLSSLSDGEHKQRRAKYRVAYSYLDLLDKHEAEIEETMTEPLSTLEKIFGDKLPSFFQKPLSSEDYAGDHA